VIKKINLLTLLTALNVTGANLLSYLLLTQNN